MSIPSFFTFFSSGYLAYADSLLSSIKQHHPDSRVLVCTLDVDANRILERFPGIELFSIEDVLSRDRVLQDLWQTRAGASRIFSSVPAMATYALSRLEANELLYYLDADTYLFSAVDRLSERMGGSSIGLYPHEFSRRLRPLLNRYGIYNAGAFVVRNNDVGTNFLNRWDELCKAWCDDVVLGDKYSNQGYLTGLAKEFSEDHVELTEAGGNIAPWNASQERISITLDGALYNGSPIVFFHFHGFKIHGGFWHFAHLRYGNTLSQKALMWLYASYLDVFQQNARRYGIPISKSKRFATGVSAGVVDALLVLLSRLLKQRIPV